MQRFCILRHMREIKDNYIKDREKFNKLVGSPPHPRLLISAVLPLQCPHCSACQPNILSSMSRQIVDLFVRTKLDLQ